MTDRPALAAALRVATPEMLREDADLHMQASLAADTIMDAMRYRRLAALALAVAEMQEHDLGVTVPDDVEPHNRDVYMRYDFATVLQAPSLPAALAALVEGAA